jgi:hypothetical protein
MSVCGLSVCSQSVCVRVCDYAAKSFCVAPYFLGAAPSKSLVKQHNDTNHSANVGQESSGTFRSSAEVSRSVTASAVYSRVRSPFLIKGKPQTGLWTRNALVPCVCLFVWNTFSKLLHAIPKTDLSTFVLDLMIYLMSYELCRMTYLMSYVILSSYDLTALVYVLLLGLRLTISRLVSMHFVLCRFYALLRTCHFCHFYETLFCLKNLHT